MMCRSLLTVATAVAVVTVEFSGPFFGPARVVVESGCSPPMFPTDRRACAAIGTGTPAP